MAVKVGESSAASLVGCIDKLEYKGKDGDEWTPYGTETKSVNTQSCFENQEDGAFMPTSGGALALGERQSWERHCIVIKDSNCPVAQKRFFFM